MNAGFGSGARLGTVTLFAVAAAQAVQYRILAENMPAALEWAEGHRLPLATFLALNVAGAAVLVLPLLIAGALTAHRVGLVSLIAYRPSDARRRLGAVPLYLLGGLAMGAVVALIDRVLFAVVPSLASLGETYPDAVYGEVQRPLSTVAFRMLWGGVYEEIVLRWGLMSLLAWAICAVLKRRGASVAAAILLSGLAFGILHLPAAYAAFTDPPGALLFRVVALNAVLGLGFGLAYARNSLEAGMAAHAAAHAGLLLSPTTQI